MRPHPDTPRHRSTVRSLFAFNEGDLVDVEVTDLAYGGAGVGRVQGFVILVARALPGDHVRARITARKPNYAEARVVEVHRRSELAIAPRCGLFSRCGGCQWMDLAYEHQLDAKQRHVAESLERIGRANGFRLHRIVRAPDIYGYRNKLEMAFAEAGDDLVLGFHAQGTEETIIDVSTCLIGSERMDRVARHVLSFLAERGYRPEAGEGPRALLRHLVLREGRRTSEVLVNLITAQGAMPDDRQLAESVMATFDDVIGVVRTVAVGHHGNGAQREHCLAGRPVLREKLGPVVYEVAPSAFFQINTEQAERLYELARDLALPDGREAVLDLYSGVGGLTLFLAGRARRVTAVENASAAVRCAEANVALNGVRNVRFIRGEARKVVRRLAAAGKHYDVVTVNPPRSGIHEDIVSAMPDLAPKRIVYVSCNPTTLARDVKGLEAIGYRLRDVLPIDMFPHSFHVETIARLEREA